MWKCDMEAFTFEEEILKHYWLRRVMLSLKMRKDPTLEQMKVGEEESQLMAIEYVLVNIGTFTFHMDFVTLGH